MGKIGYRRRKNMPHNRKRRIEKLKGMKLSNCCDALPVHESDLCSKCMEHADFYDEGEL